MLAFGLLMKTTASYYGLLQTTTRQLQETTARTTPTDHFCDHDRGPLLRTTARDGHQDDHGNDDADCGFGH